MKSDELCNNIYDDSIAWGVPLVQASLRDAVTIGRAFRGLKPHGYHQVIDGAVV